MRKFEDQEVPRAKPDETVGAGPVLRLAVPRPPAPACGSSDEGLKALVGFAIGRGYYERWNKVSGHGVTPCTGKDFPAGKDGDSR